MARGNFRGLKKPLIDIQLYLHNSCFVSDANTSATKMKKTLVSLMGKDSERENVNSLNA